MINVGIIGCGYWGPNLVRNFAELGTCKVKAVSDLNEARMDLITARYPEVKKYRDYHVMLSEAGIDAVVVATNLSTHYAVAKDVLQAGKHLLIEKPVTATADQAKALISIAEEKKVVFMTGHTFLYNMGVTETKKRVDAGDIGKVLYLHTERTNLGPIRNDTNALWDLAPHDVSMFLHITGEMPTVAAAHGGAYLKPNRDDLAFITLKFPSGVIGNIHVSWLDPCKTRKLTIIGDKKMLVFDDLNTLEPIRIFDKGVEYSKNYNSYGEFHLILRDGDILIPKVKLSEPLKSECASFIEAVGNNKKPVSDGVFGMQVVKVLEAAQRSLDQKGVPVEVEQ